MDTTQLMFIVILSIGGMGYLWSGKRRRNPPFLVAGLIMMVVPYIVSNTLVLIVVAIVCLIGPILLYNRF